METSSADKTEATTMTAMRSAAMKETQNSICENFFSRGGGVLLQTRLCPLLYHWWGAFFFNGSLYNLPYETLRLFPVVTSNFFPLYYFLKAAAARVETPTHAQWKGRGTTRLPPQAA
jgi:hypothetical protein